MRLLDEAEAARVLGVSPQRVRVLARSGALAGHWMGSSPRCHLSTLERYRDGGPAPRRRRVAVGPRPREERGAEAPAPAAVVRASLERARRDGLGFDAAWEVALAGVPRGRTSRRGVPDAAAGWRAAIVHAEASFRRAYERRPPTRRDQAVALVASWWA